MALLDPAASPEQYRARVSSSVSTDDDEILEQLVAATRLAEWELEVTPGAFNSTLSGVPRYFDGNGRSVLYLRDARGRASPLRAIGAEGIAVDTSVTGVWTTTTFDLADAWVVGQPREAAEYEEPFWRLELLLLSGAVASVGSVLTAWPLGRANIKITGTWGHAYVPDAVRELVIAITRDVRDRLTAGAAGTYQMLESGVVVRDETWRTLDRLKKSQSHRLPAVA